MELAPVNVALTTSFDATGINNFIKFLDALFNKINQFKQAGKDINSLSTEVENVIEGEYSVIKTQDELNKKLKKGSDNSRKLTGALLSIMFVGQAIEKTFMPMITSVLALAGIFNLFGAILTLILYPLLKPLIDAFMSLGKWLIDNKDSWGALIGFLIIGLAIFGFILAMVGSLGLALGGIAALAGILGIGIGALIGWVLIFALIAALVVTNWDLVSKFFIGLIQIVVGVFAFIVSTILGFIAMVLATIWDLIVNIVRVFTGELTLDEAFANIMNGIRGHAQALADFLGGIWQSIASGFWNVWDSIVGAVSRVGSWIGGFFEGRQFGGEIKENGLYYLHAGEEVISNSPAGYQGEKSTNNTFNVSANVSSDYDVAVLASQLSRYWGEQLG